MLELIIKVRYIFSESIAHFCPFEQGEPSRNCLSLKSDLEGEKKFWEILPDGCVTILEYRNNIESQLEYHNILV